MRVERGITLSTLRRVDRDKGHAGLYAPDFANAGLIASTPAAGRAYLGRVVPSRKMTVGTAAFYVDTAATADDPVDIGIYAATNLAAPLTSTGAVTGKLNVTGVRTATFTPVTLQPGVVYYAALVTTTPIGTAAKLVFAGLPSTSQQVGALFGLTAGPLECGYVTGSYPLASLATPAPAPGQVPFIALRES